LLVCSFYQSPIKSSRFPQNKIKVLLSGTCFFRIFIGGEFPHLNILKKRGRPQGKAVTAEKSWDKGRKRRKEERKKTWGARQAAGCGAYL
jgi:hypothetical protein